MKQNKQTKEAILCTEGIEKSYPRPPQLSACYKAALSLVGDNTVGSKQQRMVNRPVTYFKLLVATALQKT